MGVPPHGRDWLKDRDTAIGIQNRAYSARSSMRETQARERRERSEEDRAEA
jgi:hypothetical protein